MRPASWTEGLTKICTQHTPFMNFLVTRKSIDFYKWLQLTRFICVRKTQDCLLFAGQKLSKTNKKEHLVNFT